jgi:peptidoglycan/xylan/chitin deacetylase (PgdA/CDA1 family)
MSKYLCLSFDDGPNPDNDHTMERMLDLLEKYKVPASFFLIGNKITENNKKVIKRAIDLGCDIQNHSWTHPAMAEMSVEQIEDEYKKCDDAIVELTGKKAEFFRPPYISVSEKMYDAIKVPFICGKSSNDWDPNYDADYRYNKMLEDAENGTIYLLHVTEGNVATYEAVERAIPVLKEQGYEFVNLPTIFEKTGTKKDIYHSLWTCAKNQAEWNTWPFPG